MASAVIGGIAVAAVCLAAIPYLARLTLSVPDRADQRWWHGHDAGRERLAVSALVALVLGFLAGMASGWSALLPAYVALALTGTPLVIIDFEHHRLPDRLVRPAAVAAAVLLALAAAVRHDWGDYVRGVIGAFAVLVVLGALHVLTRGRGFGRGDVKLGAVLGGYLGFAGLLHVYYGILAGFVLGAALALVLLAVGVANRKTPLAFGPMLLLGTLIVLAFDIAPSLTGG